MEAFMKYNAATAPVHPDFAKEEKEPDWRGVSLLETIIDMLSYNDDIPLPVSTPTK